MSVVLRDNPDLRGKPVVVTPSANVNGTSEARFSYFIVPLLPLSRGRSLRSNSDNTKYFFNFFNNNVLNLLSHSLTV